MPSQPNNRRKPTHRVSAQRSRRNQQVAATLTPVSDHFCVKCGKPGPFRSPAALKCISCDELTVEERKDYHKDYHKARGAAIKRLIAEHAERFEIMMIEERTRIEQERDEEAG